MQTVISPVNTANRADLGIKPGDTVRVWQKIQEKGKTRLQAFEGLVLARKHGNEAGGTFTVRRVSGGVGIEKIFPLYSPMIDKIEIIRRSKVRRAKLYYIRDKVAREIRRQMRNMRLMSVATVSDIEEKDAAQKAEEEAAAQAEVDAKAAEEAKTIDAEATVNDEAASDTPDETVVEEAADDSKKE